MLCGVGETVSTPWDDATFPVGCHETLTVCEGPFPNEPLVCDCVVDGTDAPHWTGGC
jgi:hypothetical protein